MNAATEVLVLTTVCVLAAIIVVLIWKYSELRDERDFLRHEMRLQQARLDFRERQIRDLAATVADLREENIVLQAQAKELDTLKALIETGNRSLRAQVDPDAPTLDVRPEEL